MHLICNPIARGIACQIFVNRAIRRRDSLLSAGLNCECEIQWHFNWRLGCLHVSVIRPSLWISISRWSTSASDKQVPIRESVFEIIYYVVLVEVVKITWENRIARLYHHRKILKFSFRLYSRDTIPEECSPPRPCPTPTLRHDARDIQSAAPKVPADKWPNQYSRNADQQPKQVRKIKCNKKDWPVDYINNRAKDSWKQEGAAA